MALFLATRPEWHRELGEGERCGFALAAPLPARALVARGRVELRVLEGTAGLTIGYRPLGERRRRIPLIRLGAPVAACQAGPRVAFQPEEPFELYAGRRRLGQGLTLHPARHPDGADGYLVLGPGLALLIQGAVPHPQEGGPRPTRTA